MSLDAGGWWSEPPVDLPEPADLEPSHSKRKRSRPIIPGTLGLVSSARWGGPRKGTKAWERWKAREDDDTAGILDICIDTEYQRFGDRNRLAGIGIGVTLQPGVRHVEVMLQPPERVDLCYLIGDYIAKLVRCHVIPTWPSQINLIAHNTKADLPLFADFKRSILQHLDACQRTFVTLTRPLVLCVRDRSNHQRYISVRVYDTLLLSGFAPLKKIGDDLGFPKGDVPGDWIARMCEYVRLYPEETALYLKRDVEIPLAYMEKVDDACRELGIYGKRPVTTGGIAVKYYRGALIRHQDKSAWQDRRDREIARLGVNLDACKRRARKRIEKEIGSRVYNIHNQLRGLEDVQIEKSYHKKDGTVGVRKVWVSQEIDKATHTFMATAYHGGRNETHYFGATDPSRPVYEHDLKGAYTAAMTTIGAPDWHRMNWHPTLEDFGPTTLGCGEVEYEFDEGVRPCFPVKYRKNSLLFPRKGVATVGAPEIFLARQLGCELKLRKGVVIPWEDDYKWFERPIKKLWEMRKEAQAAEQKTLAKMFKDVGNCGYGKMAQGLDAIYNLASAKTTIDPRTGERKVIGPSKLTSPILAAYITSFIRAALGEIIGHIATGDLISVTTDSVITYVPLSELKTDGPICRAYSNARMALEGESAVIDNKVKAGQFLSWRTRAIATLVPGNSGDHEHDIKLARGGISSKYDNDDIVGWFFNHEPGQAYTARAPISFTDIARQGSHFVMNDVDKRLSFHYDFKAGQPVNVREVDTPFGPCLSFDTKPWDSVEEFEAERKLLASFRAGGRTWRTMADWRAWEAFKAGASLGGNRRGGLKGQAGRLIRRHVVCTLRGRYPYAMIAEMLTTDFNLQTTVADLWNAAREGPLNGRERAYFQQTKHAFRHSAESSKPAKYGGKQGHNGQGMGQSVKPRYKGVGPNVLQEDTYTTAGSVTTGPDWQPIVGPPPDHPPWEDL